MNINVITAWSVFVVKHKRLVYQNSIAAVFYEVIVKYNSYLKIHCLVNNDKDTTISSKQWECGFFMEIFFFFNNFY